MQADFSTFYHVEIASSAIWHAGCLTVFALKFRG
jgi:hypothetical protein